MVLSVCQSVCLSVSMSLCLSVCLSVCLSFCLSVCPRSSAQLATSRQTCSADSIHIEETGESEGSSPSWVLGQKDNWNHQEMTGKQDWTHFVDPQTGAKTMLAPSGKVWTHWSAQIDPSVTNCHHSGVPALRQSLNQINHTLWKHRVSWRKVLANLIF